MLGLSDSSTDNSWKGAVIPVGLLIFCVESGKASSPPCTSDSSPGNRDSRRILSCGRLSMLVWLKQNRCSGLCQQVQWDRLTQINESGCSHLNVYTDHLWSLGWGRSVCISVKLQVDAAGSWVVRGYSKGLVFSIWNLKLWRLLKGKNGSVFQMDWRKTKNKNVV